MDNVKRFEIYKNYFDSFDTNKNGQLEDNELRQG